MSVYRVYTSYGHRYTRATSARRAVSNVAYQLRRCGVYLPAGATCGWEAVVVPLSKPATERATA